MQLHFTVKPIERKKKSREQLDVICWGAHVHTLFSSCYPELFRNNPEQTWLSADFRALLKHVQMTLITSAGQEGTQQQQQPFLARLCLIENIICPLGETKGKTNNKRVISAAARGNKTLYTPQWRSRRSIVVCLIISWVCCSPNTCRYYCLSVCCSCGYVIFAKMT